MATSNSASVASSALGSTQSARNNHPHTTPRPIVPVQKHRSRKLFLADALAARLQGHDGVHWEREFKSLIEQGFKRHPWNFDRMLEKAAGVLPPEDFAYAQAL